MVKLHLDHWVIFVPDLAQGVAQFTELGFVVTPGGQHTSTENALILFDDGTYLELLALKPGFKRPWLRLAASIGLIGALARRKTDVRWRLLQWVCRGHGAVDWCVGVDDAEGTLHRWQAAGVPSLGSERFSRRRPDGQVARWWLGSPRDAELPFVLSDLTERVLRVPQPAPRHPNGAVGVRKMWLSVSDLEAARARFDACFEVRRSRGDGGDAGASEGAPEYIFGEQRVALVPSGHHAGMWALELRGAGDGRTTLPPEKTFGVSIVIAPR